MARPTLDWDKKLGRRLRLRELHILFAVVQWGGMAKAAKQLAMSQPAVSEAIAHLEKTLGVRLLDRTSRGVEPTVYADALLRRGVVAFDELKQGIREIEALAEPGRGEVRVACPEFMAAGLLPAIIDRLERRHPEIVVHAVDAGLGMRDYRGLRERKVDLAFARVTQAVDRDLDVEVLFDDPFLVVAADHSPWARRRNVTLSDLASERWILQPVHNVIRSLIDDAFRRKGAALPNEKVSTVSVHLRNHLVATGRYLTILPATTYWFNAKRWSLRALPVDLGIKPVPIAMLTIKNRTLSRAAEIFIEHARAVAKSAAAPSRHSQAAKAL